MSRIETPEIYEDLRSKLTNASFASGEKLKPAALQRDYGCSANTVREVLLLLSKDGLVEFTLQKGFRVRANSPQRCQDVTQFRILLEQEGAALSMAKGGVAWEARLTAAHHHLRHIESQIAHASERVKDLSLWSDAELNFHRTLISACGSQMLNDTYETVYLQFRQQMVGLQRDFESDYFHAIIEEHTAIVDAALARDTHGCRRAIYDHLKRNL